MLMGLNKKKLNMQKHHTKLCESTSYKLLSDRDFIKKKAQMCKNTHIQDKVDNFTEPLYPLILTTKKLHVVYSHNA